MTVFPPDYNLIQAFRDFWPVLVAFVSLVSLTAETRMRVRDHGMRLQELDQIVHDLKTDQGERWERLTATLEGVRREVAELKVKVDLTREDLLELKRTVRDE